MVEVMNNLLVILLQENISLEADSVTEGHIQKVILATYFRGGSTFLGEMLNNNPDAFYMFEPLNVPFNEWGSRLKKEGAGSDMYFYSNGTLL